MQCRCASLDGDADRLVYFQSALGGGLQLLDGDCISVLAALLVRDILKRLPSDVSTPSVIRLTFAKHVLSAQGSPCMLLSLFY